MIIILEVYYGAGRHIAYIPHPSDVVNGLRLNFITQPIYIFAITFVKVSIGLFLLRLTPKERFKRFIWVVQAFMAIYNTVGFVITHNTMYSRTNSKDM